MHVLVLRNLTLETVIGVYDWERVAARPLVFDLHLSFARPTALDRNTLEQHLCEWLQHCRFQLLEALGEYLTQRVIEKFTCQQVSIEIEKPGALGEITRVSVRITRPVA